MDEKNKRNFIEGFECIAPTIFSFDPPGVAEDDPSESSLDTNSPSLILLFSWTGAVPQHIAKYTSTYRAMFPSTPIMVITTVIKDLICRSSKKKQHCLLLAIEAIISHEIDSNILVHCFSEGGSHKAVQFAKTFLKRTGRKLPIETLCLDSTPGNPRYLMLADAFKKSLPPNVVIRFMGMLAAYSILASFWTCYILIGPNKNIITKTRRGLDDGNLWDTKAPRCYLYSKADKLIFWKDIEEHSEGAEGRGAPVIMVKFQDSAHCSHIKEDREVYWRAVEKTWHSRAQERSFI
jgi:hypothetical protein